MLNIALTGGIGSGKSTVTKLFQDCAQPHELAILDADVIARDLLAGTLNLEQDNALKAVYKLFGPEVFNDRLQLDRAKMRTIVFSSEQKKKQLEALLHPLVFQTIMQKIEQLKQSENPPQIIIMAIPLLFETQSNYPFDRILVIDLPEELQIQRSTLRDQCSTEQIQQIINSQIERHVRLEQADDVIDNSGSLSNLHNQILNLLMFYRSLYE